MKITGMILSGRWYLKGWLYWIIFLVFYLVYKFFPFTPLKLFCGICESNFQHYKATFFAWIITSIVEYLLVKRHIPSRQVFFYSRLTMATILPWFVFLLWYIGPALYGKMPNIPLEIVYANIITLVAGIFGTIFEKGLEQISYNRKLKTIIIILALTSLLLYIVFTFVKLPWADVFVEPHWR